MFASTHFLNILGKNSPNDFAAWLPPRTNIFNSSAKYFFSFLKFNISSLIMFPVITTLDLNFSSIPSTSS